MAKALVHVGIILIYPEYKRDRERNPKFLVI